MEHDILNEFEKKGFFCTFISSASGQTDVSQRGEELKEKIIQMATVIFETISVVGEIKIDTIEIVGNARGVLMALEDKNCVGGIFSQADNVPPVQLWGRIKELQDQLATAVASKTKAEIKLEVHILEKIKAVTGSYLGDFAERIYRNQVKKQNIKPEELSEEDVRILIFSLGKAASMIIGPTKGRELQNKLLALLK
jgi:hypothetical protein